MDSYVHQHQINQPEQMNSGLTRYRSAPSSYFTSILSNNNNASNDVFGGDDLDQLINSKGSKPDFFSRFTCNNTNTMMTVKTEVEERKDYSSVSDMVYQNESHDQQFSADIKPPNIYAMDSSSSKVVATMKTGENSNLIRHSNSPAGLFDQVDFENESGAMRGMGTANSWDDSTLISEEFLRELRDDDPKLFSHINALDSQSNEHQIRPPKRLAHHLSLPTSSTEFLALENSSEDSSVLCKLRAKRGCATHPRSIAERVRRSKISERMRKLQELVPNMDKQTNTADMLDFAVDYIKDLEKQLKALQENQCGCNCK